MVAVKVNHCAIALVFLLLFLSNDLDSSKAVFGESFVYGESHVKRSILAFWVVNSIVNSTCTWCQYFRLEWFKTCWHLEDIFLLSLIDLFFEIFDDLGIVFNLLEGLLQLLLKILVLLLVKISSILQNFDLFMNFQHFVMKLSFLFSGNCISFNIDLDPFDHFLRKSILRFSRLYLWNDFVFSKFNV